MSTTGRYVAIDLGAESGRVIVGTLREMETVHRFANGPVRVRGSIHWDVLRLYSEILKGLKLAFQKYPTGIRSIGIDTWGVDYALLDARGDVIGMPYHYRDARTDTVPERVFARAGKDRVLRATGVQFMQINTLYQVAADLADRPDLTRAARRLLMLPDLFNYWLTGHAANEYCIATTSQLFDPRARVWAWDLMDTLEIPRGWFEPVAMPGSTVGGLSPHVAAETGAPAGLPVVAPGCHDTACAVAALPVAGGGGTDHAYLSSGTWSLLGVESPTPIITDASIRHNFTNEGAADGGVRFLKNIVGLWILQECKREWDERGQVLDYAAIARLATEAGPARFTIDPDDGVYLKPGVPGDGMLDRIAASCARAGLPCPTEPGAVARGILESLARSYARTLAQVEECTGRSIRTLHIIGGGSQNDTLNQLAATATGRTVLAGPVEATALGNILTQTVAAGDVPSRDAARASIREHHGVRTFRP